MYSQSIMLIFFVICNNLVLNFGNRDTSFTTAEVIKLKEFREMVKNVATANYQIEDYYLIRYLRAYDMNLEIAKNKFETTMKWRRDNKIDTIMGNQNYRKWMNTSFLADIDAIDREGSPIIIISTGRWDVRKTVLAGNSKELSRYVNFLLETASFKTRECTNSTGRNATRVIGLFDIANYNLKQHACLPCLLVYQNIITDFENYYPGFLKLFYFINSPIIFQQVLELIRSFMRKETREILYVYGYDKAEWSKELLKHILPNQLTSQFGGTKKVKRIPSQ